MGPSSAVPDPAVPPGGAPTVSVVVPVYRVTAHVRACARSIAAQTHPVHEVLLVDDRGGDESVDLAVAELRAGGIEPRVLVHARNLGLGAARNTGLAAATGEVVWFLDSDDVAEPDLLAVLVPMLAAAGAQVAVCRTLRVDLAGRPLEVDEDPYPVTSCTGRELARLLLAGRVRGYACNKVFLRSALPVDPFPVGVAYEDFPVLLAVALSVARAALTDAALYRYTRNPASISTRFDEHTFDLLALEAAVRGQLAGAGLDRSWRGPRAEHLVRDVVQPLVNTALLAEHTGALGPGGGVLVARAVREARGRVAAGDVLALLRTRRLRLAVTAAVLRVSPRAYAALVRRAWRSAA